MVFFLISFLAGVLTVLAPCILPLLPIVIGSSEAGEKKISRRALTVIGALSLSVVVFTLLLKVSTLFIAIPNSFWALFSGMVIVLVGLAMVFPSLWTRVPFVASVSRASNKAVGSGYKKKNTWGDALIGLALGPVFTTCSPTYLFIIATVLPASFAVGFIYLLGFTLGLALALLLIAYFGQRLVNSLVARMGQADLVKRAFGALIIVVGLAIMTGYDKKFEAWILDSGYGATINFEEGLIERFSPPLRDEKLNQEQSLMNEETITVPLHLKTSFPKTDFSRATENIALVVSGGPGKDGIPALDKPRFEPLTSFSRSDDVQAVVLKDGDSVKVYPYNILVWHEIVNDVANDVPVAVTFCPLCGSAIVFERTLSDGVTTFGVSGSLFESNMIMYDRATESLWQQSTGKALAGSHFGTELSLVSFQLLTIGQVREKYPNARILSEQTGDLRDYARNPYAGYEESESFLFSPRFTDARYAAKDIFAVFRVGETSIATPWISLEDGVTRQGVVKGHEVRVTKNDGELAVSVDGTSIPFYFEMWFSWIVQHGDAGEVFDPQ